MIPVDLEKKIILDIVHVEGTGFGDVKLALCMGVYLGPAVVPALFLAAGAILALFCGGVRAVVNRPRLQRHRRTGIVTLPFARRPRYSASRAAARASSPGSTGSEVSDWRWRVSRQHGSTLLELVAILAISVVLCAIAVPGVAAVRSVFAADAAAERLALVLREAQARAQARGTAVRVSVAGDGRYSVCDVGASGESPVARGEFGAAVASNYPQGTLEFGAAGWPTLPGGVSPRAGHFTIGAASAGHTVVVQLGGCVRCA